MTADHAVLILLISLWYLDRRLALKREETLRAPLMESVQFLSRIQDLNAVLVKMIEFIEKADSMLKGFTILSEDCKRHQKALQSLVTRLGPSGHGGGASGDFRP